MATEKKHCYNCSSPFIAAAGFTSSGNPRYKCKTCGFCGLHEINRVDDPRTRAIIITAQERMLQNGLNKSLGVSFQMTLNWLKRGNSDGPVRFGGDGPSRLN